MPIFMFSYSRISVHKWSSAHNIQIILWSVAQRQKEYRVWETRSAFCLNIASICVKMFVYVYEDLFVHTHIHIMCTQASRNRLSGAVIGNNYLVLTGAKTESIRILLLLPSHSSKSSLAAIKLSQGSNLSLL